MDPTDIDWDDLLAEAIEAMKHAYCPTRTSPWSRGPDGRRLARQRLQRRKNAGYGVTLCAECGMVSDLIRSGGGTLVAVVAVNGKRGAGGPVRALPPAYLRAWRALLPGPHARRRRRHDAGPARGLWPHDLEELGSQTDAGLRDAHGVAPASSTTKKELMALFDAVDIIRVKRDGGALTPIRSTGRSTPTRRASSRTSRWPPWQWRSSCAAWIAPRSPAGRTR